MKHIAPIRHSKSKMDSVYDVGWFYLGPFFYETEFLFRPYSRTIIDHSKIMLFIVNIIKIRPCIAVSTISQL